MFNDTQKIGTSGEDPALKRTFKGHKGPISCIHFNSNLKQVATGAQDSSVILWNFKPQARPIKLIGHTGPILDVSFAPSGHLVASASKDETVRIWSNSVDTQFVTLKGHGGAIRTVNFSCDGKLLLTSSDDKTLKIYNVTDRKVLHTFTGHTNWVRTAQFNPDAKYIGSGSDDKTVRIWDVNQNIECHAFSDHAGIINSVKFHPDGSCIASGSNDKKIKIWDVRSKKLIQHYDAHSDAVNQIAFHPSGNYLLSASHDSKLKIWDLRQGRLLYTLFGHEGVVNACSFSSGGDYFASGGIDRVVMVWKSNFEENVGEFIPELTEEDRPISAPIRNDRHEHGAIKSNKTLTNMNHSAKENKPTGSPRKTGTGFSPTKTKTSQINKSVAFASTKSEKEDSVLSITKAGGFDYNKLPPILTNTLEKVVSQLDTISQTLQILEIRLGVNEDQISQLSHLVTSGKSAFQAEHKENVLAGSVRIDAQSAAQHSMRQSEIDLNMSIGSSKVLT